MRTFALGVGILAIVALAAFAIVVALNSRTRRAAGRLKVGDRIPDLAAANQDGVSVRLSDFRDRLVVLFFYPRDQTSGCTQEVRAFREHHDRLRRLGAEVVGVSNDDVRSHRSFCDKEGLPFALLADTDKSIARAFGVRSILGLYQRITFLIDGDGVIRIVFDPVKPAVHADEVAAAIAELSRAVHADSATDRATDGSADSTAYLQSRK